jgi:hypothetical protein
MVLGAREDMPLAGNGVVVGRELVDGGDQWLGNADPAISLAALTPRVRFISRKQARAWGRANASEPAVSHVAFDDTGVLHSAVHLRFGTIFEHATREGPEE